MYIAVLDEVPSHMVPVLVAHSVLNAHIKFSTCNVLPSYTTWLRDSFKKVVLKVNRKEFDKISEITAVYLGHENTTLEGTKSCIVVCPRDEYPNVIKFAKMWQP